MSKFTSEKVDKELSEKIRIKIKNLMFEKKCSNEDIAKFSNINTSTFIRKMNGVTNWKLSECISIALFFGKTVEEIFLPEKLHKSIEKIK